MGGVAVDLGEGMERKLWEDIESYPAGGGFWGVLNTLGQQQGIDFGDAGDMSVIRKMNRQRDLELDDEGRSPASDYQ